MEMAVDRNEEYTIWIFIVENLNWKCWAPPPPIEKYIKLYFCAGSCEMSSFSLYILHMAILPTKLLFWAIFTCYLVLDIGKDTVSFRNIFVENNRK